MDKWGSYSLGEIATIEIGGTPSRGISAFWANDGEDGFPWVSIADLQSRIVSDTKERITVNGVINSNVKRVPENSLIMSFKLSIGRAALAGADLYTNEAIAAIVPKDDRVNSDFLYYVVPPVAKNAVTDTAVKGSTLNKASLSKLRITVPTDSRKQQKIARILQTIDRTIEQTETLIDKYQQIKAGLMHDLFTRGIGPDGQLRPPREQAPHLYQQTPIGWIPREWEFEKISDVLDSVVDGPFGSNLKTEHYTSDPGVRVVRLQNVAEYEYNDNDKAFISENHANYLIRNQVTGNDVLIGGLGEERYPVGRSCVYPVELPPAVNKADCFRARCNPSRAENKYFMLFLNSEHARKQIRRYEQGVTRPRINTGNLKKIWVPLPSLEEQNRFISQFNSVQKIISVELRNLEKAKRQKAGLMHDLLTGKVDVKAD